MIPRLTPTQRAEWTLTKSHALVFVAVPLTLPLAVAAIPFLMAGVALLLPSMAVSKLARRLYDAGCVDWHLARVERAGGAHGRR